MPPESMSASENSAETGATAFLTVLSDTVCSVSWSDNIDGSPSLYGLPMNEVLNGAWDADYTVILGDWTKAIVGVRQDLTYKVFTEGVISDDSGAVVLNLMQQDSVALRAVMRVAWAVADPITPTSSQTDANTFAFGALVSQPT